MAPKLTSDLITAVRDQARIGTDDDAFSDAAILRFADRVVASELVPLIAQLGNGYYEAVYTAAIDTDQGHFERRLYSLPDRALGAVTGVSWMSADGEETFLAETSEVQRGSPTAYDFTSSVDGTPRFYFFRGARVGLFPNPLDGYLRVRYSAAPFPMTTDTTEFRTVTAVAQSGATERIQGDSNYPAGWTAFTTNIQILSKAEPHVPVEVIPAANLNGVIDDDIFIIRASQWPWATGTVLGVEEEGDYVIADFASPIVQLPAEAFPGLVVRTAALCLRTIGEGDVANLLMQEYQIVTQMLQTALADRNRSQATTFVNHNSHMRLGGRYRGLR